MIDIEKLIDDYKAMSYDWQHCNDEIIRALVKLGELQKKEQFYDAFKGGKYIVGVDTAKCGNDSFSFDDIRKAADKLYSIELLGIGDYCYLVSYIERIDKAFLIEERYYKND